MATRLFCLIIVGCMSFVAAADETPQIQVLLSIKVSEKGSNGKSVRVFCDPTIVTSTGKPFSFVAGGTLKPRTGGDELAFGTRVNGTMTGVPDGKIRLAAKVELGNIIAPDVDQETDITRTETLDIRTVLRLGQPKRFEYSDSKWCEVRIEPVSAGKLPIASSATSIGTAPK